MGGTLSADAPPWQPSGSIALETTITPIASSPMLSLPLTAPPNVPPPAISPGIWERQGVDNWAPPPWLGAVDASSASLGALGPSVPIDAAAWGAPGGPPPPPAGPPPIVQPPPRKEEPAPESTAQEDCLI